LNKPTTLYLSKQYKYPLAALKSLSILDQSDTDCFTCYKRLVSMLWSTRALAASSLGPEWWHEHKCSLYLDQWWSSNLAIIGDKFKERCCMGKRKLCL